ncbi:hypothetical protein BEL04_10185 [Mucilaginibacter sp. PPCGB 2223]|nr:hypothetical protein BEL04_10185 [Mucilaginibacter sp. PPCGB 2223]
MKRIDTIMPRETEKYFFLNSQGGLKNEKHLQYLKYVVFGRCLRPGYPCPSGRRALIRLQALATLAGIPVCQQAGAPIPNAGGWVGTRIRNTKDTYGLADFGLAVYLNTSPG